MRKYIQATLFVMLHLAFAANARADWVSDYTFDVAIATSANGPFVPSATAWSSNVPAGFTSSSILVDAAKYPQGYVVNGLLIHPVGSVGVFLGNYDKNLLGVTHAPFFLRLTVHDKASDLSDAVIFGGEFDVPGPAPFNLAPKFFGQEVRKIGNSYYTIAALPPIGAPIGQGYGPDDTKFIVEGLELDVRIDRSDLAPTPEPASLLLALPAALALGIVIRKRRCV